MKIVQRLPLELIIWIVAIVILYNLPYDDNGASSICPIHRAGFDWCPGCGLGRSIHLLMHGHFKASFDAHWLGVPVFLTLSYRVISLIFIYSRQQFNTK